jgi:transcriptional regulator with GAF, ATPase, and Fis domain
VSKNKKETEHKEEKENQLVGVSQHIRDIRDRIIKAAESNLTVLIEGPTGTGKELIAKNIHLESKRKGKPPQVVNCSTIPRDLFESELFGHKKGAFTGATRDQIGKVELADVSTLFLDEIGDLAIEHQPKILRFLEDGIFTPLGGTQKRANVRIISATNKDLLDEVEQKKFRKDLYYRLAKFRIRTLPLAKRKEDIVCLMNHFRHGRKLTREEAKKRYLLYACSFPGNVRQLSDFCGSDTELKEVEEELIKCILNLAKELGIHTEKGGFDDLPMRSGAIERPHGIDHSIENAEAMARDKRSLGKFRELTFLLRVLGCLKKHPDVVKGVRAYEIIVLAQETSLSKEKIGETLKIRKSDLMGKNFKSTFGFEYPLNKNHYYVLHPYDAYPEPYELHGFEKPGRDFYNRYGFWLS